VLYEMGTPPPGFKTRESFFESAFHMGIGTASRWTHPSNSSTASRSVSPVSPATPTGLCLGDPGFGEPHADLLMARRKDLGHSPR